MVKISNALERSMKTVPTISLLSIADIHSSIMFMRAVWQEWLLLNPDWLEYNNLLLSRYDFKWSFFFKNQR